MCIGLLVGVLQSPTKWPPLTSRINLVYCKEGSSAWSLNILMPFVQLTLCMCSLYLWYTIMYATQDMCCTSTVVVLWWLRTSILLPRHLKFSTHEKSMVRRNSATFCGFDLKKCHGINPTLEIFFDLET